MLSSLKLLFAVVMLMIPRDVIVVDAFATSTLISKTRDHDVILGRRVPPLFVSVSFTEEEETTTKELATATATTKISPDESTAIVAVNENENDIDKINPIKEETEEEENETEKLMRQVKESGVAGVISYAAWELGFWAVSVPVCIFGYRELTGYVRAIKSSYSVQAII
ncbi:MAG: hypothetical protein ACI8RD_002713 [Bacillariaceae sp.]|jgi:hypothetical protein